MGYLPKQRRRGQARACVNSKHQGLCFFASSRDGRKVKKKVIPTAYLAEKSLSADVVYLAGHLAELVFVEDDALDGGQLVIRPLG